MEHSPAREECAGAHPRADVATSERSWQLARALNRLERALQGGGGQHAELSGYHAKRHEFEPEFDQDAELMVSDLEFRESDTQVRCPARFPCGHAHLCCIRRALQWQRMSSDMGHAQPGQSLYAQIKHQAQ